MCHVSCDAAVMLMLLLLLLLLLPKQYVEWTYEYEKQCDEECERDVTRG